MKRLQIIFSVFLLLSIACVDESKNNQKSLKMKQLHWLLGEWQRINERPERTSLEVWELQEDGSLAGVGLTTEGDKLVFKESLKLQLEEDKIQYIADVSHNDTPTVFELTSLEENKMVFENPNHDFPKQILYERLSADSMQAVIAGNGKEIVFQFKRLK